MILIDTVYINNSGGKVLLDYLVEKLEESGIKAFYLFDSRVKDSYNFIPANRKLYLNASLWNRFKFYFGNHKKFNKVLCFASLPPLFKLKAIVYTYFHQVLYLSIPSDYNFKKKLIIKIKSLISKSLKHKTDYWVVQSESVKKELSFKFRIDDSKVLIIPFYPPLVSEETIYRDPNKFLYVSEGHVHKNHYRLIDAFLHFYTKYGKGELHLTISDKNSDLCSKIDNLNKAGIPIINHGFINRQKLIKLYRSCEFLIYPSLAESFGLGVLEALENGCTIIGANRPYIHSACVPSLAFDPESVNDITKAFENAFERNFKPGKQLLFNEIDKIISLLS